MYRQNCRTEELMAVMTRRFMGVSDALPRKRVVNVTRAGREGMLTGMSSFRPLSADDLRNLAEFHALDSLQIYLLLSGRAHSQ